MQNYYVNVISSLEKVLPQPQLGSRTNISRISGFLGQRVSFQIAYSFSGQYRLDQVLAQGTHNPNIQIEAQGELAQYTKIRKIDYVPVLTAVDFNLHDDDYISKEAGIYPDILSDFDGWVQFIPNQWRSLWIDCTLPDAISANDYELRFIFKDTAGKKVAACAVSIHVIAKALPKQKLMHTEWFYPDCLVDYYKYPAYSAEHWHSIEGFMRLAVQRGVNVIYTPLFTPALDTLIGGERTTVQLVQVNLQNGEYSFNFDKLLHWLRLAQEVGYEYFEIGHLFTQWGAKYAPKIIATVNGTEKQIFGWHTKGTSPEYTAFLNALLPQLTALLQRLGLTEKAIFHISDEPTVHNAESYRAAKAIVVPHLKGMKIIDALSHVELYTDGTVEIPVPTSDSAHEFINAGWKHRWMYHCCAQGVEVANRFIAMPAYRNRALGIQLYYHEMEGFLHWGYNFYSAQYSLFPINPYIVNDSADTFPAGDPFIVYPGENGEPVESMRLPVLSDAMYDVRAMELLEELAGRDAVIKLIEKTSNCPITFKSYPREIPYYTELWESLCAEIEKRL